MVGGTDCADCGADSRAVADLLVRMNPAIILDAIEHWDLGQDFGPTAGKILS